MMTKRARPEPRAIRGRLTTRAATRRQFLPGSVLLPGLGMNGQNTRRPHTASTGGSANRTPARAMSRPTAEEMPNPRVPGMTAKARVSNDSTTVTFEATMAGIVFFQAAERAAR